MYLRIDNAGSLDRRFLQLIGLGSKGGDATKGKGTEKKFGVFGTGAKFASYASIRLGLECAISSTDEQGRYVLRFRTEPVTVQGVEAQRILLEYHTLRHGERATTTKPAVRLVRTDVTTNAFIEWDKPLGDDESEAFKILREYVCNAYDEDPDTIITTSEVHGFAPEGRTSVFLRLTDDIRHVIEEAPERYFKFLRRGSQSYKVKGHGAIYESSDSEATRVFHMGVLAGCKRSSWTRSIYDYSLDDRRVVSDQRVIKDWNAFLEALGTMLASISDRGMVETLCRHVFLRNARLEATALGRAAPTLPEAAVRTWREVIEEHYGSRDLCIPCDIVQIDGDAEQVYGHAVARDAPKGFRDFMKRLGYPSAKDIAPELPEMIRVRFDDLDESSRREFMAAFRLCAKHFPSRARLPIVFFHVQDESKRQRILGHAIGKGGMKEIWVACETPTSLRGGMLGLLEMLIHEGRHIETKAGDYDRNFMRVAEKDIVGLIFRAEGMPLFPDGTKVPDLGDSTAITPSFVPVDAACSEDVGPVAYVPFDDETHAINEVMRVLFRRWDEDGP